MKNSYILIPDDKFIRRYDYPYITLFQGNFRYNFDFKLIGNIISKEE